MDNDKQFEEILEYLKAKFGGKLLLSVDEASAVLGVASQTIYNQTSKTAKKPFPIRVVRMGGKKFDIHDIARYIAG